jgi:hypothetical protein
MLRYRLPHPRSDERMKEYLKHKHLGYHVDVCRPIIEVEHPENMLQVPRAYLESYLNEFGSAGLDSSQMQERDKLLRASPDNPKDVDTSALDNKRFFMSEYLEGSAVDALNYIVLFARAGLIEITVPTTAGDIARLSSLSTLTTEQLHNGVFQLTDGQSSQLASGEAGAARRDQREKTLVLAGLLGLIEYNNTPDIPQLRDLLVRTRLRGLMNPERHAAHHTNAGIIQAAREQQTSQETKLDIMQDNRSRKSVHSFHRLYWSLGRQRIGRTTSHGGAGKEVDIVF